MRSTAFATATAILSTIVAGQTFTDCNPTEKKCPPDPALGTTLTTDFTKGASEDWEVAQGTTLTYDPELGAEFVIASQGQAPTIGLGKYIMFGKVEVVMRPSAGQGTVSSFILESGDLDEIDWEWLGSDDGQVQTNFFGKGNTTTYDRGAFHAVEKPVETFHTYTIDWTAESTKWYINGNLVRTLNFGDASALGGKNYPQTPMKVKMGSWIGCASQEAMTDPGTRGTCQWAGGPIDLKAGPFNMYVKSVKIQDYGCASEYSYSDLSGSWQSIVSSGKCNGDKVPPSKPSAPGYSTTSRPASTSSAPILIEKSSSFSISSAQHTPSANNTRPASTLATATSTSANLQEAQRSATPINTPAPASANAGVPVKKYGSLDIVVGLLGLGMGYLFM